MADKSAMETPAPPLYPSAGPATVLDLDQLQADELVDRELTPQTPASIRIVLGTLAAFAP